jgi:hypothetical protein
MASHVKVLGWLNVFFGVLGLIAALAILGGSMAVASVLGIGGDEAMVPVHIVVLIGGALAVFTLLLSIPGFFFAAFALVHVPIGTALGLYTFWVLLKPETELLFRPA